MLVSALKAEPALADKDLAQVVVQQMVDKAMAQVVVQQPVGKQMPAMETEAVMNQ